MLNKILFCILFSLSFQVFSQDFTPTLSDLNSIFENGNQEKAQEQLKKKIILLENKKTNPLILARHYNLLGEIYYSISDIDIAYSYWNKSYLLIKKNYGLNSVFLAESYSLLSRYYGFLIVKDSALFFSDKAVKLCWIKKDSLAFIPVNKIYREYAYNLKIEKEEENFLTSRIQSRLFFDSALYYHNQYMPDNILFKAQIYHDIGNTFTDDALEYRLNIKDALKAKECFFKANEFYDKEINIYKSRWGNKNEKIANAYFTKNISYSVAFGRDSIIKCLIMLQKALIALIPSFNDESILSSPNPPYNFCNKVFLTTLLNDKIYFFNALYSTTGNILYLQAGYQNCLLADELWQFSISDLNSLQVHKALIYGASPQYNSIQLTEKYYELTKNDSVKNNLFRWIDFSKYASLLKQASKNNLQHSTTSFSISQIQKKLNPDQCIINQYFYGSYFIATFITKDKAEIFPSVVSLKTYNKADSLLYFLKKYDEKKYCLTAKYLYDSLLSATIKKLPTTISHLIIIPHNQLATIPYDALIVNDCSNYQQADFLINHYSISYGLSASLLFNTNSDSAIDNTISFLAPGFKSHTSLPFSKQLKSNLERDFTLGYVNNIGESPNSILHLATHAYCNNYESKNSYILLSDIDSIFLRNVSQKKLGYKLAVFSACETASGQQERGEGTINFNRSLYFAGIKSAITSLWKIDDETSTEILKLFYSNLAKGETASLALCESKREYLKNSKTIDDKNPIYWAGLIYTGNDLTLNNKNSPTSILWLILGTSIIIGIILLRKFFF